MSDASADHAAPAMSVVVVTPDRLDTVRQTLAHLVAQTARDRLEVILVAPDDSVARQIPSGWNRAFQRLQVIGVGPIGDVDKAAAPAIRRAAAPVVALVEDHAFPEPRWAEALLAAHARGDWAAVGSTVVNANGDSPLSWSNQLMAYGEWTEPVVRGVAANVSRHNISFKKRALEPYLDDLETVLGRAGGLLQRLRKAGEQFYVEPEARVRHVNPSRLASTVQLRFFGGRLSAATRVRRERWPAWKRAVYVVGAPLIPAVRLFKARQQLMHLPLRRKIDIVPTFLGVLLLDATGQMIGFATGPGRSEARLAAFEYHRERHLRPAERALLVGPVAAGGDVG